MKGEGGRSIQRESQQYQKQEKDMIEKWED